MVDIQSLLKALPVYGLEPQILAHIAGFPRQKTDPKAYISENITFWEPPAGQHEPYVEPLDFMRRVFVYEGMDDEGALRLAENQYGRLRPNLDIFERPIFYDPLEPDTSECVSINKLLGYMRANRLLSDHLIDFFEKASEVTKSIPLFGDEDGRFFRFKLTDLPNTPFPRTMIEFSPGIPWAIWDYDEAEFLAWRESMMPVAEFLEKELGESVYYFQDLDDELDDDYVHRFLELHWCCSFKPESPYVRYLMEASGAKDVQELKAALIDPASYTTPFKNDGIFSEAVIWRSLTYIPPGTRKTVGVVFATEEAWPVAKSIIMSQINAEMNVIAPYEFLHDSISVPCWEYPPGFKEAIRFCNHDYLRTYPLRNETIERPIEFLARIDELFVVENDKTRRNVAWDLNVSDSIQELLWKAIELEIPTHFYSINSFSTDSGTIKTCLEKHGVPERVIVQDELRREYTSQLTVVRLDFDWSSSGLWDEQCRMISYDYIDLPLPLIRRIIAWHDKYDEKLEEVTSGTGPCDEMYEKHESEKHVIALDLQRSLGANIDVQVRSEQGWKSIVLF